MSCLSQLQVLAIIQKKRIDYFEALKMEQINSPETLVSYRKITTWGRNPKAFGQQQILYHITATLWPQYVAIQTLACKRPHSTCYFSFFKGQVGGGARVCCPVCTSKAQTMYMFLSQEGRRQTSLQLWLARESPPTSSIPRSKDQTS